LIVTLWIVPARGRCQHEHPRADHVGRGQTGANVQRSITALIIMLTIGLLFALAVCVVILPRLLYPPLSSTELE
jgi:hypothetical protein